MDEKESREAKEKEHGRVRAMGGKRRGARPGEGI